MTEPATARWRQMLEEWAGQRGLGAKRDGVGNMLVSIPASPGKERAAPVLVQGHVDMVCEKNADTKHDFTQDPIKLLVDGMPDSVFTHSRMLRFSVASFRRYGLAIRSRSTPFAVSFGARLPISNCP